MSDKQPDQNGLLFAFALDGRGDGRKVQWDEIKAWTPRDGLLWIHLDAKSTGTEHWLLEESGLDEVAREGLLAGEVRPRTVVSQDGTLIILRGVNLNPGADPEDMVSIRMWVDENRVITTVRRTVLSITDLQKALAKGQGPSHLGEFVTSLADRLVERMSDVIEETDDSVDKLEEDIQSADPEHLRAGLASTRRQIISLRRYLAPQREALNRLQLERIPWFSDEDRGRLREIMDRTIHYVEALDSARDRATVTHEELNGRLSEQVEKRMYLLAMVAAIFLPLTFLTGLLGINVGGIPGAENRWAFLGVALILFAILLVQLWFFKRRRWI
ncbi:MAG: zinc transporter ZntB [Fidelibacterota bacterium]|nr:MAG: zinc transporter ZntB [Candidatus Neomarinimicrobiota bacterium]